MEEGLSDVKEDTELARTGSLAECMGCFSSMELEAARGGKSGLLAGDRTKEPEELLPTGPWQTMAAVG